jgi:hypothetical protein
MKDPDVDFFKFLGRIFYKKLKIYEISIENNFIFYSKAIENKIEDISICSESECIEVEVDERTGKRRRFLIDESSVSFEKLTSNEQLLKLESFSENDFLSISSSDDYGSVNSSIDFSGSSLEFSSVPSIDYPASFTQADVNNRAIHSAISSLKNLIKIDTENISIPNGSFNLIIFESFFYNNFIFFAPLDDIVNVYECLSLSDLNEKLLICSIQCILQSKINLKPKKYFSFLPAQQNYLKRYKRVKNDIWRYRLTL